MNISHHELLELIPQARPMVMIDTLLRCDAECTQTALTVDQNNIFYTDAGLSESALIENMAQTAAVRAGYFAHQKNEAVRKGFIGAVKNARIHFLPQAGEKLITELRPIADLGDVSVVKCFITANSKRCAEAEFKIFLQN